MPIWVVDEDNANKNETLGTDEQVFELIDLYFCDSALSDFWIDSKKNIETNSRDIYFQVGAASYRTPYKKELAIKFLNIIEKQ